MKKYILIDQMKNDGDLFYDILGEDMEEAIKKAQSTWDRLSSYDKKKRDAFQVVCVDQAVSVDDEDFYDNSDIVADLLCKEEME